MEGVLEIFGSLEGLDTKSLDRSRGQTLRAIYRGSCALYAPPQVVES